MARPKTVDSKIVSTVVSINPASLLTHVSADETVAVPGLRVGYPVHAWTEGALELGLIFSNFHCSAKDVLKYRVLNSTAGTVNGAAFDFSVVQG